MKTLLMLVANGSRARIFLVRGGQFELLEAPAHPASRARTAELVSDRPGRAFDDSGSHANHRSGMEPPLDAHELELAAFARQLAERCTAHARRTRANQVLLVAPPRMLGRLRAALEPSVARRVVATVPHDYTGKGEAELAGMLHAMGLPTGVPTPA